MTATELESMRQALLELGFEIGPRNPQLNTDYPGEFMVAEWYCPEELPTKNGTNGPWCIVGDDLNSLIQQAYDVWCA